MYALIIAGGEGERLRPLTQDRPKPMVPVAGKPILEHQVRWLAHQGVDNVIFCCGYRADVVQSYFGDGSKWGVRAHYSLEEEPLGRGGALKLGYQLVPANEDIILALNGDILTGQSLDPLLLQHRQHKAVATIMLVRLNSPYGIVKTDRRGRVTSFLEKPPLPHWMNAGVYACSPELFRCLPDKGDHETITFPELAADRKLSGYRSHAYWRAVDTAKDLAEAEAESGNWLDLWRKCE